MDQKLDNLKPDWKTNSINEEKWKILTELFPNCFNHEKEFNETLFKAELNLKNDDVNQKYEFSWVGKNESIHLSNSVTSNTLIPIYDKSYNFDNTRNILIEGDNLEVLKTLQKSYYKKIDVIYIDPPYNTGNDFVYNDIFAQNTKDFKLKNGFIDENRKKIIITNQKTNAKYHTNWLNMIYPRLKLAYDLLNDEGIIFISIDDNEQSKLKMICDEIFGEENFISILIWHARRGGGNDAKNVTIDHEYVLCYAKNILKCKLIGLKKSDDDFEFEDEYLNERGKYNLQQFDWASLAYSASLDYPIECPDGTLIFAGHATENDCIIRKNNITSRNDWCWMMSKETFEKAKNEGFIVFQKNKNNIWNVRVKTYQYVSYKNPDKKIERRLKLRSVLNDDFGITRNGKDDLDSLNLKEIFSYPKPISLLKNLLKYFDNKNAVVLDFFAGSGTTGHAVMDLNKEDGGNRQFILVQIPEPTENNYFSTISDITRERIIRSIKKFNYKNEGFKYFQLNTTNFEQFDNSNLNILQQALMEKHTFKNDRNLNDVLYEIILKEGYDLNTHFNFLEIENNKVFVNDNNNLIIAINNEPYQNIHKTIKTIYEQHQNELLKVYLVDDNFRNDEQKINSLNQIKLISNDIKVWIL